MQPLPIPRIHLIEKIHAWHPISPGSTIWESGHWQYLDEQVAEQLVGGMMYFHEKRSERSYMSGRIINYRLATDDERRPGSIIFIFERSVPDSRIYAGETGWEPQNLAHINIYPYRKIQF